MMAYHKARVKGAHTFFLFGYFKIVFLRCSGAPLLHIFKPDHVLQEYAKNLKVFHNSLAITVEDLPLSHQVYISYHLCTSSLLPCCKHSRRGFSSPTTWALSIRQVCSIPLLLLYWQRKLETAWSPNLKLNLETKFIQPSLTIPQITLKNARHFCGL